LVVLGWFWGGSGGRAGACGSLKPVVTLKLPCRREAIQEQRSRAEPDSNRSIALVVGIAFVLRLAVITLGHTYRITPRRDHFQFGWEMGRLARSIAQGHGFSSPTDHDSGPSAWTAPFYPYVLAAVFKVFGIYSSASAWVILTFNSLFAALTCGTLYRVGDRIFGKLVAWRTAWTWAVFPYLIYWPVRVVWEASFTTFLLSFILWRVIDLADRKTPRTSDWVVFGLLWGFMALTNTAVLILFPCLLVWVLCQLSPVSRRFRGAIVAVLVVLLAVTPWTIRNFRTFGRLIFIRDNLPLELHEANNDASGGRWTRSEHPGNDRKSMARFEQLGEIRFMDEKRQEFDRFVNDHPGKFAWFTLERIGYFWAAPPQETIVGRFQFRIARHTGFLLAAIFAGAGLAVMFARKNPYRWLMAPFIMVYPLPYYFVNPFPRYKHPIEPVILILIVYLLWAAQAIQIRPRLRRSKNFEAVTSS
jgi:4-amino-4-deoxy-L-arabinose transferase-like glycosyltransferase